MFDAVVKDRDNDALSCVAQLPSPDHIHVHSAVRTTILRQQHYC